jgi:hypothetical protein
MSVTVADIQAMPGLSAMADADVQFWIDESAAWVGSVFGTTGSTTHDRATRYWVAHALTVQTGIGMGSSGPVNSRKVGDVSVGYGPSGGGSIDPGWLLLTQWGRLFLGMARVYTAPSIPVV